METEILLQTLMQVLNSYGYIPGEETEGATACAEKFTEALNQYIEYKISHIIDTKRKLATEERVKIVDHMNGNMKYMTVYVKALTALHAAPEPVTNIFTLSHEEINAWMQEYDQWYNDDRSSAMQIG